MIGRTIRTETTGARPRGRDFAIVAGFVAAVGLVGQAAILAMTTQPAAAPKSAVRLDAGPIEKREIAFSRRIL